MSIMISFYLHGSYNVHIQAAQLRLQFICAIQDGDTALDIAAKFGHMEVAEYLIKAGANVNITDDVSIA